MPAATTVRIYFSLPEETKAAITQVSVMKMSKKTIKTLKRNGAASKKTLYKNNYHLLPDYNQIFRSLMNIESPHPELDPRLKYNALYFQPTHPYYTKSVLRMLSYALSSSLNNYYTLLKNYGVVVTEESKLTQNKKEHLVAQNNCVKAKKTSIIRQKKVLIVQAQNEAKKPLLETERVQGGQKCSLSKVPIAANPSCEFKNIQNTEVLKCSRHNGQASNLDIKEHLKDYKDQSLIGETKLPKFGMGAKERQRIRENLLMRQVKNWPVKQRPSGICREVRSLQI